jgi:hypothetical protein
MLVVSCSTQDSETILAVKKQLKIYPESTLQDIYKSFFQDEFGPGHLLSDSAGAREYLEWEISEMESRGNYIAEPCGIGMNFYRVPLDLVKDGKITKEDFLAAFMQSAKSFTLPETEMWKRKWDLIVREIEKSKLPVNNFTEDKVSLDVMLKKGETVVHHSRSYSERYEPHYRIMSKEQWNKLAKKYSIL